MKQLQNPRANTLTNDAFTGPAGQIVIDSNRWEIRLHDNETPGGHRILNLQQLIEIFMSKESEFGQVVFAESDRGILTRIGDRQYALRLLKEGLGIQITTAVDETEENEAGTAADFWIGIDPEYLATLLLSKAAGKLVYAGVSTGTADALLITVPTGWADEDGSVVAFKSHINANNAATMTITVGAIANPTHPILTAGGSALVGELIDTNHIVLLMRVGGNYHVIGEVTAQEMGILPIAGMTATNVQDALEELVTGAGGGGDDGSDNSFWTFASFNQAAPNHGTADENIPLAAGERRLVRGTTANGVQRSGGREGEEVAVSSSLTFMGAGFTAQTMMVHRIGNAIWVSHVQPVRHTAESKYRVASKDHFGDVLEGATSVKVSGTRRGNIQQADFTWIYSDVGVVAA